MITRLLCLLSLGIFSSVSAFSESAPNQWPFSKFYGTYTVSTCTGGTININCDYKLLKIAAGDHTSSGKIIPTVNFRFANDLTTGAFSESSFMNNDYRNIKYSESDTDANFQNTYAVDDRDGSQTIDKISMVKQKSNDWLLTFKYEKITKDGSSLKKEVNFNLKQQTK